MSIIKKISVIKSVLAFQLLTLLLACNSNDKRERTGDGKADSVHMATNLPDQAFAFKNIESTSMVKSFYYDYTGDRLYADPTRTIQFTKLDSLQRGALIAPVLTNIDSAYVTKYMKAYFIAKQDKIGEYTPVIVWISGDDYNALMYIVLNKESKPVSHVTLYGGEEGGPAAETDSTITYPPYKHSLVKGSEISSYILHVQASKSKKPVPATIDSVTYKMIIQPDGQIATHLVDSTRYKRIYKEPA